MVALVLGAAFAPPVDAAGDEELAFLRVINQYRAQQGLQPLQLSPTISEACYRHNSDMAKYDFFDHYTVRSDWFAAKASPWDRMAASGYNHNTHKGENIAAGYASAESVFAAWKNSPGHDANMRSPHFKVIGISLLYVAGSHYKYYWTTDFGGYVDPSVAAAAAQAAAPATTTTTRPAAPAPPKGGFTDVDRSAPYAAAITLLCERGITKGFDDGTFGPDRPVTRQQFAKMVVLTLGYQVGDIRACGFRDVDAKLDASDPLYPAGYIAVCKDRGIALGTDDGRFQPWNNITRAQLITMATRAAGVPACSANHVTPFGRFDCGTHYDWAQRAHAAGLLDGLPGMGPLYDFGKAATRAEVCVLLANLIGR